MIVLLSTLHFKELDLLYDCVHKFRSDVMAVMIHSKYGYEPPEWVQADARIDRWYKKRRAKQHGAFSLAKSKEMQHESRRVRNSTSNQSKLL